MSKKIASLIFVVMLVVGYIFAATYMVDYSKPLKYIFGKENMPNGLADIMQAQKDGKIGQSDFRYLPTPTLRIEHYNVDKNVALSGINIRYSLISILSLDPQITTIEVDHAMVGLAASDTNWQNHDQLIHDLIAKNILNISLKINELEFIEQDNDVPLSIKGFKFTAGNNLSQFTGEINNYGKLEGSIQQQDNDTQLEVKIHGEEFRAQVSENFSSGKLTSGNIVINTKDFIHKLFGKVSDLRHFDDVLSSNVSTDITFDISKENGFLKLSNVSIQSEEIDASANFELHESSGDINFNIFVKNLDFTKIGRAPSELLQDSYITSSLNFHKNKIAGELIVDKILFSKDREMSKINLKLKTNENAELIFEKFYGQLDKTGNFNVTGSAVSNMYRTLFTGFVRLNHPDLNNLVSYFFEDKVRTNSKIPFSLQSKVKMSAVELFLEDISMKMPSNNLTGSLSAKFIGQTPRINSDINLRVIDFDNANLPGITEIVNYLYSLAQDTKNSDYLGKFSAIRKIGSISNINISSDYVRYNNNYYGAINSNINLSPAYLKFSNIQLRNNSDYIDGSLEIDVKSVVPKITINIDDGDVSVNFLKAQGLMDLRKKLNEQIATDKFNLYVDSYFTRISDNENELGRVIFQGNLKDKILKIDKFEADAFGGRITQAGTLSFDPIRANFVWALNSVDLKYLSKIVPYGYFNDKGAISASGMWTSSGNSLDQLLYNLYTRTNIVTKNIQINNLSIDDFVNKINVPEYDILNLPEDIRIALLTGNTKIQDLEAVLQINKGQLELSNLRFKSQFATGKGGMNLDLYKQEIDFEAVLTFLATRSRSDNYKDNYIKVTLPVKAKGNFFKPKKTVDTEHVKQVINQRR